MKAPAILALVTAALSVALLTLLHFLSPEFDPAWRMVSEYANGEYGWVLSCFFAAWGISSLSLLVALHTQIKSRSGRVGLVFLTVAGVGQILAAIFDINHPLHDLVGNIAIPAFAVATILITKSLKRVDSWKLFTKKLMRLAHASWISVVLLIISFITLVGTYMGSGASISEGAAITTIPDGVIALVGWTNRLLVVVFAAWTALAAWSLIRK